METAAVMSFDEPIWLRRTLRKARRWAESSPLTALQPARNGQVRLAQQDERRLRTDADAVRVLPVCKQMWSVSADDADAGEARTQIDAHEAVLVHKALDLLGEGCLLARCLDEVAEVDTAVPPADREDGSNAVGLGGRHELVDVGFGLIRRDFEAVLRSDGDCRSVEGCFSPTAMRRDTSGSPK